ncbi:mannose-1-phosphate guanylyltransferase [Ornithinimicrobium sp. Y1847]|uniref:mannose-1-phosphate guanylyltransferase n=1 Tax=Ornithinimicrobium sp. Y1847 TaxID=3405419 RepID=UPI003B681EA6
MPHAVDAAELVDFTAVIPAGGSGTRLWPLSRASSPKFLHDLTGSGRSLLQSTVDRLEPLVGSRVLVVTGSRHADAVRAQLPSLSEDNLLVEPSPRGSMPAIGLAAAVLERRDPHAVLGSFAADHVIGDADAFGETVRQAVAAARQGVLVTIGITPTYPATGFGYVRVGDPRPVTGAPAVRRVRTFVEKPDAEHASSYVESGDYLWNAGMFVVRAADLLELLGAHHPQMVRLLREIAAAPARIDELWPSLTKIAIDHAVAEPAAAAGRVAVVPASFSWDDVGDFASLASLLAESHDHPGMRVLGEGRFVVNEGSTGVVAAHGGRTVVTLGIPDVVVIDTPDALLVTTREHCQDVKSVVSALQRLGREDLT